MPEEREGSVVEVEREVEAAGADPRQLYALVPEQVLQVPNVVSEKERKKKGTTEPGKARQHAWNDASRCESGRREVGCELLLADTAECRVLLCVTSGSGRAG
jgi:hypothetical protein